MCLINKRSAACVLIFAALALVASSPIRGVGRHVPFQLITEETQYVCPMHPDVVSKSPGSCPKCGMTLKAQAPGAGSTLSQDARATGGKQAADLASAGSLNVPDTLVYDQNDNRLRFYTDLVRGKTVA